MLKKIIFIAIFAAVLAVITSGPVMAAFGLEQTAQNAGYDLGADNPALTIKSVVTVILGFVAIIFFTLTLYAGFIWMIARGKEERVETAKRILEAAILGLIIVAAAYAFSTFILARLGSGDITGCCRIGTIESQKTANECLDLGGGWTEGQCL